MPTVLTQNVECQPGNLFYEKPLAQMWGREGRPRPELAWPGSLVLGLLLPREGAPSLGGELQGRWAGGSPGSHYRNKTGSGDSLEPTGPYWSLWRCQANTDFPLPFCSTSVSVLESMFDPWDTNTNETLFFLSSSFSSSLYNHKIC